MHGLVVLGIPAAPPSQPICYIRLQIKYLQLYMHSKLQVCLPT